LNRFRGPAMYEFGVFARDGASWLTDRSCSTLSGAGRTAWIECSRGAKPADLSVEQLARVDSCST
jgi:hypothetical protein